ncbi:SDR family oxidoreductase [Oscillochloris sp. ZM17-4]|uniref:SDR family NAD(P)-dependent oxidoreductase n=1 Tax=Oscillochloris sp. ZM17-4 TaxID=2866714 RepID=UPI001C733113|nr:SDR family NAD(P)-dependent oxidoreductase [Oscillochloris sp. ZM17-4]MBX0330736.1 SDR family oxidoreductase [Oscillochloris sp. ZM17-4]
MNTPLAGHVAFVSGAGTGIGYAVCRSLADAGALVALNDIDPDAARDAAARLNEGRVADAVRAYPGDIADVEWVRATIDEVGARLGGPHICVANAGITRFGSFLDDEPTGFDRLMAVNLRGTYFTAQAAARAMIAQKIAGRIILMASVTGIRVVGGLGTYGISKAGIMAMARALAVELGPRGITVNAVAPGATVTERTLSETPHYERDWGALMPAGRANQGSDIAAAVRFLASPEAAQITGQTLVVDGGWSLSGRMPEGY